MTQAATSSSRTPLLSPQFMHQLDRLDVLSRKVLAGKLQGERRSKKRGRSVEFADYRQYVAGDDLRFIDWNLYARLDKLFLRLFLEEEDLSLSVLLDTTRSMHFGEPNKLHFGKQVAAALGYIGLVHYNRVSVFTFNRTITDSLRDLRGRRPVPRLLDFIDKAGSASPAAPEAADMTREPDAGDLAAVFRRFAALQRYKGIVVVISDFFDDGDLGDALRYLTGDKYDVFALHVLSPQELDPTKASLVGDLTLRDAENLATTEVSISPALIKRYRKTLDAWRNQVRQQCLKRDAAYLLSDTATAFDDLVLRYLRERGLLG